MAENENKIVDLERLKGYAKKTHAKEVNEAYLVHGLAGRYDYTFTYTDALFDDNWGNEATWNPSLAEHTVVFDGTSYTVQHKVPSPVDADYSDGVGGYLGDVNLVDFPFYIMLSPDAAGTVWFYVSAAPGNHTVKIDNKNLGTVTVDPSCSAYVGSGERRIPACCADLMDKNVTALEITFDGVDYTLEPQHESDSTYDDWYFGNLHMMDSSYPDTGEPFFCDMYVFHYIGDEGRTFKVYAGNGEHTVAYKAINPIPDTIFPESYVHNNDPKTKGTLIHNGSPRNSVDGNPNSYGQYAVSVGAGSSASGYNSFAAGYGARADANNAIAIGYGSRAKGNSSIAIGNELAEVTPTTASGQSATAIGVNAIATGDLSVALAESAARGMESLAMRGGVAYGRRSVAIGMCTSARSQDQQVRGICNVEDTENKYADILGRGTVKKDAQGFIVVDTRKNIEATTVAGDKKMKGDVYVHANDDSSGGVKVVSPYDFANDYAPASTYNKGDIVISEGNIYKAKEDGITGPWNADKWEQIQNADLFKPRAKDVPIDDVDKRYDAEEVETALKEVSDDIGWVEQDGIIFDGDVTLNASGKTALPADLYVLPGETYTVEFNGTSTSLTSNLNSVGILQIGGQSGDAITVKLYKSTPTSTCEITVTGSANVSSHLTIKGPLQHFGQAKALPNSNIKNGSGIYSLQAGTAIASGSYSFAGGPGNVASGLNSFAYGRGCSSSGQQSVAFGQQTEATGTNAFAEGGLTHATATDAHAEGGYTTASGDCAHAEGIYSKATETAAHAEGESFANGKYSHAEGLYTTATGKDSHSEGYGTTANNNDQHVQGRGNVVDTTNKFADIIGNGVVQSDNTQHKAIVSDPRNISATTWTGDQILHGDVYVHANYNSENGVKVVSPYTFTNDYDAANTYATGDLCIYSGNIYKAKEDDITGAWNAAKWEQIDIKDLFGGSVEYATKAEVEAMIEDIFG